MGAVRDTVKGGGRLLFVGTKRQAASKVAEKAVRDDMANIEKGAYDIAKENGMNIVKLSKSETKALKEASSSVIDDYIGRTGGKGGVGDKLVQAARKL